MNIVSKEVIVKEFGVKPAIDVMEEIESRVSFLANYLRNTCADAYVLGISGGVDSTTGGRLAQLAVERLRADDYTAKFVAVRLPYGEQCDEADAQDALNFIKPDLVLTVDIKPACDAIMAAMNLGLDEHKHDFVLGNVKARQRMIVQYAIAGAMNGIVIGTDHAAEAIMGFFTKHGDGAADVIPLTGLNKRQVRSLAMYLGAPEGLFNKVAMAGLENLNPLKTDEESHGVTYPQIDDFLEGKDVDAKAEAKIIRQYTLTTHKRALPVAPQSA